jgi:hypothetical protein
MQRSCACLAALFLATVAAAPGSETKSDKGPWVQLFNGKDLSGWDTWLGKPYKSKQPVGLNKDPKGVYKVVEEDGKPAIRISGEIFGALTSKKQYGNYQLRLEFKWGEQRWPPRAKDRRDSGLLYHCVGKQGAGGSFWMRSLEFQIMEQDCGDFYSVAYAAGTGPYVDVEGVQKKPGDPVTYKKGGQKFTVPGKGIPNRIIKDRDYEKPRGQWNTLELFTVGPTSVHVVNGHVVMVLTNPRQIVPDKLIGDKGMPMTAGKIQLQSEGAEVFYRNIALRPIDRIPEKLLK